MEYELLSPAKTVFQKKKKKERKKERKRGPAKTTGISTSWGPERDKVILCNILNMMRLISITTSFKYNTIYF